MTAGSRNRHGVHLRLRAALLTSASMLPRMTSAAPDRPAAQPTRKQRRDGTKRRHGQRGRTGTAPLAALEIRDPSDVRSLVAEVPAMSAPEVAAAYERARGAFSTWRRANPLDRAAVMSACAGLIRSRAGRGP